MECMEFKHMNSHDIYRHAHAHKQVPIKHETSRDLSRLSRMYREGASPTEKKPIIPTTLNLPWQPPKAQNAPKWITHEGL